MTALAAAGWSALAASSLLVGALVTRVLSPSPRVIAIVMALGSGVLIASVSYDLVEEARRAGAPTHAVLAMLLAGAVVFVAGARLIARVGGKRRKSPTGPGDDGEKQALAIALGSVLDGVPESFVLGLTVLSGGVSPQLFAGIALSNLPEGMASSSGLSRAGWPLRRIIRMWLLVIVASATAGALGVVALQFAPVAITGGVQAFAAGALLAMIVDSMVPEAYEIERDWTGLLVVTGFVATLLLGSIA